MTITFEFAGLPPDGLVFTYSPLFEAVFSLHVLVEPKHHPVQHGWVRRCHRLPLLLRKEISAFAFAYRDYLPALVLPSPRGGYGSIEAELEALCRVSPEVARFEFTRPFYGGRVPRDPRALDRPAVQRRILTGAEAAGPETLAIARQALEEPDAVLGRFGKLLADYWKTAFGAEWRRVEPALAEAVIEGGRRAAADGVLGLLEELSPVLRVDRTHQRVWVEQAHEHYVTLGPSDIFVLMPSVYVAPHVRLGCDTRPAGIAYPAPTVQREAGARIPPEDLLRVVRGLGDDTRLRILRAVAERPRSTQELAPLIGLSEAALSKQLRHLAGAGLVSARRDGYYVLYTLVPERIQALSTALLSFLGRESAHGSVSARAVE